ncbi:MAG: hypothetical protein WC822_03420 [Candidatus Paceibacterota bacterium]|jgi:hypothetical protein
MKNKINNNLILGLGMLFILSLGIFLMPTKASAYTRYYFTPDEVDTSNPKPSISYITPRSVEQINGKITITVTGYGFTQNSIVKKNNSNRNTTFIDSSNLLVDIYPNDVYNQNEFFLTVYNGEPGGGYSNASLFTIKNKTASTISTVNNTSSTNNSNYNYSYNNSNSTAGINTNNLNSSSASDINESYGSLTANALVGSNSAMPSGLAQWIFLGIIICLIIFLWRYVHRSKEIYMAEPMKHA